MAAPINILMETAAELDESFTETGEKANRAPRKISKTEKRKHASYEMVNEWVMEVWKHVAMNERILDGFY